MAKGKGLNDQLDPWIVHKDSQIFIYKRNSYVLSRNVNKNERPKKHFFQNFVSVYGIFDFKWRFARMAVTNKKNITKKYCFKLQVSEVCVICKYWRTWTRVSDAVILKDVVLDQFCEDFPLANEVYIKSDNAGSYYRNYCFEVLYSIDTADLKKNLTTKILL